MYSSLYHVKNLIARRVNTEVILHLCWECPSDTLATLSIPDMKKSIEDWPNFQITFRIVVTPHGKC